MKTLSITCDGCDKDIVGRPGFSDTYIVMSSALKPTEKTNVRYDVIQHPQFSREMHFHNLDCFDLWREKP